MENSVTSHLMPKTSYIRVWKLGDVNNKIYPNQETLDKFAEMINSIDFSKDVDIIWGPDLQLQCVEVRQGFEVINK